RRPRSKPAANQRTSTYRKNATSPCGLVANPCKHRLVVHQRLLTETSRNVKQIELRRLRESCIRYQPQARYVAQRLESLAEDSVGGVRNAREDLERAGQIDLVQALEQ